MVRGVIEGLTVLAIAGLIGGMYYLKSEEDKATRQSDEVAAEVQRFRGELSLRAASGLATERNPRGWPVTVDPKWFDDRPPRNDLLSSDRVWVEVAPEHHAKLQHPPVRIALDRTFASFWYNPYLGIVRARVPLMLSEEESLALYNKINSVSVESLYESAPSEPTESEAQGVSTAGAAEGSPAEMGPPLP